MLRWFQALMPREDRFFELYNRHAATLVDGAKALCELLRGGPGVTDAAHRIFAFEEQADAISREILLLVRRSFITPFDRSDIKDLINTLDDTIDQMRKTAKAVLLFEVTTLEPEMAQMGECILRAANLTVEAVKLAAAMRDNAARLHTITEEIIHLEEDSDTLNDTGIKALYKKHQHGNAMSYIVGIEIYDHLEKVMDRFEDVANRISGIAIEQV
jgi:predicted phosphate transport protein (TIGR00153 family)